MLLKDFLREGAARLEPLYLPAEAKNIMLMLCEERIGTRNYTHLVEPGFTINDNSVGTLMADLERLASGEPIQYVLGYTEFCGLRFRVTPDVLIPRPETELMCRWAIEEGSRFQNPVRILDLCTGSGCIAWTLALSIPGAEVIAIDISEQALQVAKSQEFSSLLEEKGARAPEFMLADVLGDIILPEPDRFDRILSNPPYILESQKKDMRPNVLDYEPSCALFVPDEDPLLFYRAIARWSRRLLAPDGKGMTEINELFGAATKQVFLEAGFDTVEGVKDFYGKDRFVFYSR